MLPMKRPTNHLMIFTLMALTLVATSGCQPQGLPELAKNGALPVVAPSDYDTADGDPYLVEIGNDSIATLIESQSDFLVYIGNEYCSSCIAFRPALIEYIHKQRTLVYHYDNIENTLVYPDLYASYPDYFPQYPVTPSLFFFKGGALRTRQDGITRMFDYNTYLPLMQGYSSVVDVFAIHNSQALEMSLSTHDGLYLSYDRNSAAVVTNYLTTLRPYLKENKIALYQVEVSLEPSLWDELGALNAAYASGSFLLSLIDGSVTSAIDMAKTDAAALTAWLVQNA